MSEDVKRAIFHARLRWIGAPLLMSAVVMLGYAIYRSMVGGSGWTVAFSIFAFAVSLASFGANHDATMSYAFSGRGDGLPTNLRDELEEELERDRDGVVGARPAPKIGIVMPMVAVLAQVWVAWRLFGGAA